VASLGRFPTLLAADPADAAEVLLSVALLGRLAAFAAGFGPAHLARNVFHADLPLGRPPLRWLELIDRHLLPERLLTKPCHRTKATMRARAPGHRPVSLRVLNVGGQPA